MRYNTIKYNDIANSVGVSVTLFVQGCDKHCFNCFNSETWDFNEGQEFTDETMNQILEGIRANNVKRNFSILGGEPLHPNNVAEVKQIVQKVKKEYPDILIFIWTGYYLWELNQRTEDKDLSYILNNIDVLIDGPYVDCQRDITLLLRGSKNQTIYPLSSAGEKSLENLTK